MSKVGEKKVFAHSFDAGGRQSGGCRRGLSVALPEPPLRLKENPDVIWTPAYYGDEEDFKEGENDGENWVILFTKENSQLILKKGEKRYPISGQYEVKIGDEIIKANLLYMLIRRVRKITGSGGDETAQRKGASLVFYKDLKYFAGSSKLETFTRKNNDELIAKGEFGEVWLANHYKEVSCHSALSYDILINICGSSTNLTKSVLMSTHFMLKWAQNCACDW
ncbi:unnamed protein product [Hydatigera taeniaeformis]|uniref:Protein kinase domain-containing protein n=1 Tax=Hydatigena taeniaeformis TaxID=6205 RepID=A0A0R3WSL1_HYDTA|nr:unnamed protein product [Hydatigera taeniaeformis]